MNIRIRTPWIKAAVLGLGGSLVVALLVLAFMWPAKTSTAHHLPVSLAGPEAAVTAVEKQLEQASPGTFVVHRAADRTEAESQIKRRVTYGAIVLSTGNRGQPAPPEVLTAPAAGAAPTQMLTGLASKLQADMGKQIAAAGGDPASAKVTVIPLVQLSANDPMGSGLALAALPLALGGVIGGVLLSTKVHGTWRRLGGAAVFAAAAGGLLVLIMQAWFGYLQGNAWLNVAAIGLTVGATATFMIGCVKLLGSPGIALGPIVTVLLGNPLSGSNAPWQFIPEPWGAIGQFLVPGAGNTLLRDISYFPEANTAQQWLTLAAWVIFGALLALAGEALKRRRLAGSSPRVATSP